MELLDRYCGRDIMGYEDIMGHYGIYVGFFLSLLLLLYPENCSQS